MAIDSTALLKGLKPVLKALDADLLARAQDPGVEAGLKAAWEREKTAGRTAANFKLWCRRRTAQVSIAWVLSVVFVRTLEDRGFLARRRIAGPGAEDSEQQFTALAPFLTPRDYLLMVFGELAKLPGAVDLFDAQHNPVWVLAPSADGAHLLLDFFRHPSKKGEAPPAFDGEDTRFLGDLYQKLSEDVRKRFALLQTPEFVEEFILDQTLDPAVKAFGLSGVRLIDPTCGSGHFLLGAFHRLFDAWQAESPGEDRQVLAQRALAQVYGCDLNPYAVAIARFRLTLECLQLTGIDKLGRAPRLSLNLCVADSLLHGVEGEQMRLSGTVDNETRKTWGDLLFALEDEVEAFRILNQRYHVVVGNPPYITEKDPNKREKYRDLYESAAGKFALAAPFTERFFGLAQPEGFVGMINANSFTKRDFGVALIEKVLPNLDVSKVVDTSGAYIPGHGIPTLLLFGRNRKPGDDDVVAVLGKRGEAEEPVDPATAPVWSEIIEHHDDMGFDGRYVSVEPIPREQMAEHPWVLVGGGARALKARIVGSTEPLENWASHIGPCAIPGEDDAYSFPARIPTLVRRHVIPIVEGTNIRDWQAKGIPWAIYPYASLGGPVLPQLPRDLERWFFNYRALLKRRKAFGVAQEDRGKAWFEFRDHYTNKLRTNLSIAFAFVATHNHFILDRGGKVFKQSAPVIKLKAQYDEDDHLALLGLLNSSVACFWMKMVFFDKGNGGYGGGRASEAWERFYEFDSTKLKQFPAQTAFAGRRIDFVKRMVELVDARDALQPGRQLPVLLSTKAHPSRHSIEAFFSDVWERYAQHTAQLVALQEELDWQSYVAYGLLEEHLASLASGPNEDSLALPLGCRPFEVCLAGASEAGEVTTRYFERHERQCVVEVPQSVPQTQRDRVAQRLSVIKSNQALQLLEQSEFKRRWSPIAWDDEVKAALQAYLLDRIESLLEEQPKQAATTARQLAAELQRDVKTQAVAEVYAGESAPDLEHLVTDLVKAESVPYGAALRYTDTGLEKHNAWRETWALQRREDAGEKVGEIPVPPRYATGDYRRTTYWSHRGQLDVPKERFVLYPGAETDNDSSPWLGWAGWDHLQKATALSGIYQQRKTEEGWEKERLLPLLAGLQELVPWLIQWHNEPSETYGGQRLGDFFRDFVSGEAHAFGCSTADLEAWRPLETTRRRNNDDNKKTASKPKLATEALLAVFDLNGAELAQSDLAKRLGVSSAVVGKVAKVCIEAGQLVQTNGRPKRFALANAQRSEP